MSHLILATEVLRAVFLVFLTGLELKDPSTPTFVKVVFKGNKTTPFSPFLHSIFTCFKIVFELSVWHIKVLFFKPLYCLLRVLGDLDRFDHP